MKAENFKGSLKKVCNHGGIHEWDELTEDYEVENHKRRMISFILSFYRRGRVKGKRKKSVKVAHRKSDTRRCR